MSSGSEPRVFSSLVKFSAILVLIGVALTFNHKFEWTWLGTLGWWAVLLGIVLAILLFYVLVVLASHRWFGRDSFYRLIEQLHKLTRTLTWWQIIVLSIMAGAGEELLFRGFVQSWLNAWGGVVIAITFSSLVFALLHAMTFYYFSLALLISALLGLLFHASNSMLLVVVIHAVYDIVALTVIAKYPYILRPLQ